MVVTDPRRLAPEVAGACAAAAAAAAFAAAAEVVVDSSAYEMKFALSRGGRSR